MKFNVIFQLEGPAGRSETPNTTNPVEAKDLDSVLRALVGKLPENKQMGLTCVGVKVEPVANS